SGISIELWRKIAAGAHLRFRLVETQNVQDLLDDVAKGTLDAGVGAVTVTAGRARSVDFTQPFYNTGLGIAVPVNESAWVSIGRALLSFGFFQAVAVLLCFAMAVGFLIWLLERPENRTFRRRSQGTRLQLLVVDHRHDAGGSRSECAGNASGANRRNRVDDRFRYRHSRVHRRHHPPPSRAEGSKARFTASTTCDPCASVLSRTLRQPTTSLVSSFPFEHFRTFKAAYLH
ncbi:transporter substrate-binding domain-containing protein, partial [Bradyrhizobium valentinum]|uniref:transporter substrate-binding domain-containing protein n=1 Tax=Bradyrhizobium valentinum TaxID=1518501 RepID=UPI001FD8F0D9